MPPQPSCCYAGSHVEGPIRDRLSEKDSGSLNGEAHAEERKADPLAHRVLRVGGPDGVIRGSQGIASPPS
jgi:hypothetical protein